MKYTPIIISNILYYYVSKYIGIFQISDSNVDLMPKLICLSEEKEEKISHLANGWMCLDRIFKQWLDSG